MRPDAIVDAAIASVPDLTPTLARDLRALVTTLLAASPSAAIVLGGSVAGARYGAAGRSGGHDVDLFLIEPTRRAALRTLRSEPLRRRLEALPLAVAAEIVVVWDDLVRRGRTTVYGRVLVGDAALADAIARSPAPPAPNLLRTAYLYLIESLLEPDDADRLVAKALLTAFRAWRRERETRAVAMQDLFALDATTAAIAAARPALDPAVARCLDEALAWQSGRPGSWNAVAARPVALRFLDAIHEPRPARPLRRFLRHASTRLHFGASPFRVIDPDRGFVAAASAVVAVAIDAPMGTSPPMGASASRVPATAPLGARGVRGDEPALERAERLVDRLTGMRASAPWGTRADWGIGDPTVTGARVTSTTRDRIERAARALAAYGRYDPHKIILPAAPPTPRPASSDTALISIVIPCRDGAATLPALLASVAHQEVPAGWSVETVVADNASTDASADVAARLGATVVVERRPGASAARNAGVRAARGATLVFLDADVRIAGRDFLHHVVRAFARAPEVGIVGAAIECDEPTGAWGHADHMASFFNWQATQLAEKRHFHPSAALAVRREAWDATGGFAVDVLRFHDFDFCRRARDLGFAVWFEPAARVAHRPRERAAAALQHAFHWGWNVRRVYAPYDRRRWWFLDRPLLFGLNVPVEVANRIWVVAKRWLWRRPIDTVVLAPLLVALLTAWGAGVAAGGYRWISDERRRAGTVGHASAVDDNN